jgi:hypothetical protein
MGSMTGRAAGYCAGFNAPGYANPAGAGRGFYGRGGGWGGRGGGRGYRHWYYATGLPGWARGGNPGPYYGPAESLKPEVEAQTLKAQADALRSQLEAIDKRISELTTAE